MPVTQDPVQQDDTRNSWLIFDNNMQHVLPVQSPHTQMTTGAETPHWCALRSATALVLPWDFSELPSPRTSEIRAQLASSGRRLCATSLGHSRCPPQMSPATPIYPPAPKQASGFAQTVPGPPETFFTLPDLFSSVLG